MKFRYDKLNIEHNLEDEGLTFWIIENKNAFYGVVRSIYTAMEDRTSEFHIFDNDAEVSVRKACVLIDGISTLKIDGTQFKKKLYESFQEELSDEESIKALNEINTQVLSLLETLVGKSDVPIEYEPDIDLKEILLAFKVSARLPNMSFMESIVEYIKSMRHIMGNAIYIVINCGAFISGDGYKELDKLAKYENLKILFVDGSFTFQEVQWRKYILDQDLCEI